MVRGRLRDSDRPEVERSSAYRFQLSRSQYFSLRMETDSVSGT